MNRLYRLLQERACLFRTESSPPGASRTVRTEVTVNISETTVFMGGMSSEAFDACPLCGHQLAPAQAAGEIARLEGEPAPPPPT